MASVTDPSAPPTPQPPPPAVGSAPVAPPPYAAAVRPGASISLHRTAVLERTAIALVGVAAFFALLRSVVARRVRTDAQAYLDGALGDDDLIEATAPAVVVTLVQLLAVLAAGILVIIWMYRIADNLRLLHRPSRWAPGWAIGGWFLPPLLFIIPTLMLTELWRSSDPDTPTGSDPSVRSRSASPLIPAWFILYSVIPIVLTVLPGRGPLAALGGSEDQLARSFTDSQLVNDLGAIATLAAALTFGVMARSIGTRHRQLTGEDRS